MGVARESWWRAAVIYQVYVRSFSDSDGDGIGDLAGVRSRLDYLADLGVDAIWLNPFFVSPQIDAGYDVADYREVDDMFGSLADFDALVADAHGRGLRVIIDLVPNHTSSEHAWFRSAVVAGRGSVERSRYLFRDGRGHDGSQPPNDWLSVFGGSAWTRVTEPDGSPGQWYLHLFAAEQPDLDWTNPQVRAEFESILRFWFDRGVDGFRVDVGHGLLKHPEMPDIAGAFAASGPAVQGHPHWDRDDVHDVYRQWRRVSDSYPGDRTFVAEVWVDSAERLARYVRPDELHTAFNFNFLLAPWDAVALRSVIDESFVALGEVGATPTWVLSNHDVARHVTRYGGGEQGTRRARAAVMLMLALPGGAYIYQGEELGLPEVLDLPDEALQDPTFARSGGVDRGRDGCRVPMPWAGVAPPFEFSPTGESWLPQPVEWVELTTERQASDPASMLTLYRSALRIRRAMLVSDTQAPTWIDGGDGVVAFRRGTAFTCVVNVGDDPVAPPSEVRAGEDAILASAPLGPDGLIPGNTAVWYGRVVTL